MSLRELVEPDCGGANPLMRLGAHMMRDTTHKDAGISGLIHPQQQQQQQQRAQKFDENQLVNEFLLAQMSNAPPPQTFRMDALLQEMREIETNNFLPQRGPNVINVVNDVSSREWANEFGMKDTGPEPVMDFDNFMQNTSNPIKFQEPVQVIPPAEPNIRWTSQFFDMVDSNANAENEIQQAAGKVIESVSDAQEELKYSEFVNFMHNLSDNSIKIDNGQVMDNTWANEYDRKFNNAITETDETTTTTTTTNMTNDWVSDFNLQKQNDLEATEDYNTQFWNRLQDEWKKISKEDNNQHPWLSEFGEYYEPYKEYKFDEENPMLNIENAFEKGKEFLVKGDIPSAVLCFESAVQQEPDNADIWELLGTSQAENEKDPNAIAALKKSLKLNPNNSNVLMALAVAYTNESLQSNALRMLINWLKVNEKYQQLIPVKLLEMANIDMDISGGGGDDDGAVGGTSSLIRGPELREVQDLYLQCVQKNPNIIDPDVQEALGVLFNLSSEYDKAVDCFRAAIHIRPNNAKTWNRLGASLANGYRSVEAVEAYQRALELQPGFIRVRYNVGIICINLKAYNEAAEHFLTALNHQATSMQRSGLNKTTSINQMSETIWSTLRMVISLMGRVDLQPSVDSRDLINLNRAFGIGNE